MAASGAGFLQGSLDLFYKSRAQFGKQPWKQIGAASASAVTLGSLMSAKASGLAKRQGAVEKNSLDLYRPSVSTWVSPFASLSLAPEEEVVEPQTGVVFPGVSPEGKQLTGVGLRKKSIFGLKSITVYAYGVYADPDSIRSNLSSKYGSSIDEELGKKEQLFADVTEADVGLTVRLVIVYGKLKIGSIRSAFEESVGKGLKKFSGEDNKDLLHRFTSQFTDDLKLPKNTTIDISRLPGQVLQTTINGEEVGSVQSPLLCQALFDLYIGVDAFDKPAREKMGSGFAALLFE